MIYAVFSDIQGAFGKLQEFLKTSQKHNPDRYFCLGDIVQNGDSFDENRCISRVREAGCIAVKGNHERELLERMGKDKEIENRFYQDNVEFISGLPERVREARYLFAHTITGTRIRNHEDTRKEFGLLEPGIVLCFIGHSHRPAIFRESKGIVREMSFDVELDLTIGRYFINPGGMGVIGEPSTYVLFNTDTNRVELRRL